MLRINPTYNANQAKSYYGSQADYYTQDQEHPGVWGGKGAALLGLNGTVGKADFEALCDNRNPQTGEPLTPRTNSKRIIGYDFSFHAPKSLSLLFATTEDKALLSAFQQSVDETMALIEAEMQTRVRKNGESGERTTANMIWGRFDHLTSRPVDGIPDMHLHSHCFTLNLTCDEAETTWKAGYFRNLKRDAPYYQSVFHSKLTTRMRQLNLPLAKTPEGWEIQGFSRSTLEKFSRRTKQIEEVARSKGITDAEEKAELGAKTREGKAKHLSMSQLRTLWMDRLDSSERKQIERLARQSVPCPESGLEAPQALDFACRHLFERHSVVSERQLLGEMLQSGLGRFSLEDAQKTLDHSQVIIREVNGRRLATTADVLAEEEKLIGIARDGRGTAVPLGSSGHRLKRDWLNTGQKAAVHHLLTSTDKIMLVHGSAGVGKTTLMQEVAEGIEQNGRRVYAFAPSAEASRGVLRREGFEAETVARLLVDTKLQDKTKGQVFWIDESGLLGTQAMLKLFELADRMDCRVILSGDRRQHGAVERGSVLKILEEQAGLKVAEVKEIQRQKGEYKDAVKCLVDGRAEEGFDKLDALGWVREIDAEDRYQQLANDYLATAKTGKQALVISPTHAEGAKATTAIRQALREDGQIGPKDRTISVLTRVDLTEAQRGKEAQHYLGDVLQFHQNSKGIRMGERIIVQEGQILPLDQARHFQVFRPGSLSLASGDRIRITKGGKTQDGHKLENGAMFAVAGFTQKGDIRLQNGWILDKAYGHFTHGYVTTSHASQGKTVDHVLLCQSSQSWSATSREQFYVSASRARKNVTIYTDDKEALRESIQKSNDRLSATELLSPASARHPIQERIRLQKAAQGNRSVRKEPRIAPPHLREAVRD